MLRIWIGPEMEGFDKGKETLFIQSDKTLSFKTIKDIITKYKPERVYLGAGRTTFKGFTYYKDDKKFISFCIENGIKIVIESTVEDLKYLMYYLKDSEIILSIRFNNTNINDISNIKLKLDDDKTVKVFNNDDFALTCLDTLENCIFTDVDKVIYEEE